MTEVHPTAIVHSSVHLGEAVRVGPFAIIEPEARIGNHCEIAARAVIKRGVILDDHNQVGEGSVLGGEPQHLTAAGNGGVRVGKHNIFRENTTVHRALESETVIGEHNYFMVNAHVAHDTVVGDHCIIANNVMLGGHVAVADHAYISGGVAVHQFCRVGREVMIGGQARITRDVPPYVMICGDTSRVVGLNHVGLRRRGYESNQVRELKQAYRLIYRSEMRWQEILATLERNHPEGPAAEFGKFLAVGERGFVPERRKRPPATLRVFPAGELSEDERRAAAG